MTFVFSIIKSVSIMDTSERSPIMIMSIDKQIKMGLSLSLPVNDPGPHFIKFAKGKLWTIFMSQNKKKNLQPSSVWLANLPESDNYLWNVTIHIFVKRSLALHSGKYSMNRQTERKLDRGKETYVGLPGRGVGSGSGKEDKGIFFFTTG